MSIGFWLVVGTSLVFGQPTQISGIVSSVDGVLPWQITIKLVPAGQGSGRRQTTEVVEDGAFKFEDVAPGQYFINLSRGSGYIWTDETNDLLRSTRWRPGDRASLSIVKGGVITGLVTRPTGEPAAGVKVQIVPIKSGLRGEQMVGKTDDRGRYRIYGIKPGPYIVMAFPEQPLFSPSFHPAGPRDSAAEVDVIANQERFDVNIRLGEEIGWTISGKIYNPKEGVLSNIRLVSAESRREVSSGSSNPQGYFLLTGIADGEYLLSAEEASRVVAAPVTVKVRGKGVNGLELKLIPLVEASANIQVSLPSGSCNGSALKPELLRLDLKKRPSSDQERFSEAEAIPNKDGEAFFTPMLPGDYRLTLTGGDYVYLRQLRHAGRLISTETVPISASAPNQLALTLDYGGRIAGRNPAAKYIYIFKANTQLAAIVETDPKGQFKSEALAPAEYLVLPSAEKLNPNDVKVLGRKDRAAAQTVQLGRCQTVEPIFRPR